MKPKISIIVPIYNVEKYLHRCVDSLLAQTFKDIEIILVDDGSPDNCPGICDEYSGKDNRVKVLHKLNGGLSDARNAGIDAAGGDYMLFVDSDDWIEPNALKSLYAGITESKSDLAVCSYYIDYTQNGHVICKDFTSQKQIYKLGDVSGLIYELDTVGMFNIVWNKIYKASIIRNNMIRFDVNGMPGEDLLFNCEYFKNIKQATVINEKLYHYMKQGEDTLANTFRNDLFEKILKFNAARKKLYDFYNMSELECQICYANTYVGYIFTCVPNIYRRECNMNFKERTHFLRKILKLDELQKNRKICMKNNSHIKLFVFLLRVNSAFLMNSTYSILFLLRNNFEKLYLIVRKKVLIKD